MVALARASAAGRGEGAGSEHARGAVAITPRRSARTWSCGSSSRARRARRRRAATAGGSPLAETAECVHAWTAGEDLLEHLAVLYAIEAGQPEISRTKIEGLTAHYGYTEEGPAVEYFRLHELRDVEHARRGRAS